MTTAAATQFLPAIATGSAARESLVVSLHDIAPLNRQVVEPLLSRLNRLGVRTCSLLVVPDYHHQNPMASDPSFLAWLRDLEDGDNEIVIHGFSMHAHAVRAKPSASNRLRFTRKARGVFDPTAEALRRTWLCAMFLSGRSEAAEVFIAPAWLLGAC
jgi:predicted deacetylase